MIIEISINDNILILYFHFDLDAEYEQYREHYDQKHDIVLVESNLERKIIYVIIRFLNICVNRFAFAESIVIMIIIVIVFSLAIKNVVIIQMKHCIHYERNYHVKSECRDKHSHLKRDRDQSDREDQSNRNDRDKRRRKNDNDNNNDSNIRSDDDDEDVEKSHKFYIVMFFETLSTMSVIFV